MVEENPRITARRFAAMLPRLFGVPLHLATQLVSIHGQSRVEGVTLRLPDGSTQQIAADGVIVTGAFTPAATLAQLGHLRSEEHTSELQSLMRLSYAVFCL